MINESLSHVLKPLGAVFRTAVAVRNQLYNRGWLQMRDCGAPVISIGNLTAGGTGKTPFTALLAQSLKEKGKRVAIVSRGYKSPSEKLVAKVTLDGLSQSSSKFGDEPVMLAHKLPGVPVYVGAQKLAVACRAVEVESPDIVLADDAFQHRKLKRVFDVVLLDASEPWWHFRPMPSGRMREPFSALKRAHAIVLSKANLADPVRLERVRDAARSAIDSSRMPIFVEVEYRINNFIPLRSFHSQVDELIPAARLRPEKLFLLSAIGRPEGFHELVKVETGAEIVGYRSFGDHYYFTKDDIGEIEKAAQRAGATKIVVTEKDAVKLNVDHFTMSEPLVSRLEAVPDKNWDEFHARLTGALL
jgi:tetraacyldisaccharide 4'-kinase